MFGGLGGVWRARFRQVSTLVDSNLIDRGIIGFACPAYCAKRV